MIDEQTSTQGASSSLLARAADPAGCRDPGRGPGARVRAADVLHPVGVDGAHAATSTTGCWSTSSSTTSGHRTAARSSCSRRPSSWRTSPDDEDFIKRVIGVGGDHVVCCDDQKRLTINGQPLDEPYIYSPTTASATRPATSRSTSPCPTGRLWMMGDHRSASGDSREHWTARAGDIMAATIPERRRRRAGVRGLLAGGPGDVAVGAGDVRERPDPRLTAGAPAGPRDAERAPSGAAAVVLWRVMSDVRSDRRAARRGCCWSTRPGGC